MDRWKAEQGRGREKRKIRREKIRRERVRRKKMQVREKVGKSRNTVFFGGFVAPEGWKVGSLKRRMRRHRPLWREAHFEVKMYKTDQVRTTFGSWDVETVHAVVARSTFWSQHVQNTPGPDHFWKLRCRKSARRCGAKHSWRSIVYGSWFTIHSLRAMVTRHGRLGLRIMVYEPWFTSHGLRSIVYEPWFTSHGLRSIVYEPWFTEAEVNPQDPLVNHGFPHSHCNFGASLSGHIPVIVWSHNKNVGMLRYASMPQISVTGNRRFWPEIFATEPGLWAPKWDPIVSAPMASGTILWERKFWLFGLVDIEGFSSNLTWAMAKHFEWWFVI